jgi:hypothetical protein
MLLVSRTWKRGSVAASATRSEYSCSLCLETISLRGIEDAAGLAMGAPESASASRCRAGRWVYLTRSRGQWPVVDENDLLASALEGRYFVLESLLDISSAVVGRNGVAVLD